MLLPSREPSLRKCDIKIVKLPKGFQHAFGAVYDNFSRYASRNRELYLPRISVPTQDERRAIGVLCAMDLYRSIGGTIKRYDDLLWKRMMICSPHTGWLECWYKNTYFCQLARLCPHCRFRQTQKVAFVCRDRWHDIRQERPYYVQSVAMDDIRQFKAVYRDVSHERAKLIRCVGKKHVTMQNLYWERCGNTNRLRFTCTVIVDKPREKDEYWKLMKDPINRIIQTGMKFPTLNLMVDPEEFFQLRDTKFKAYRPSLMSGTS